MLHSPYMRPLWLWRGVVVACCSCGVLWLWCGMVCVVRRDMCGAAEYVWCGEVCVVWCVWRSEEAINILS